MNPQRFGGSDVMNRISYDTGTYRRRTQSRPRLQHQLRDRRNGPRPQDPTPTHRRIRRRTATPPCATSSSASTSNPSARNPTNPTSKTRLPQRRPRHHRLQTDKRHELGIRINPNANVYSGPRHRLPHRLRRRRRPPNNSHRPARRPPVMLIDIGTNTEIIAGNKNQLHAEMVLPRRPSIRRRKRNLRHARLRRSDVERVGQIPSRSQEARTTSETLQPQGTPEGPGRVPAPELERGKCPNDKGGYSGPLIASHIGYDVAAKLLTGSRSTSKTGDARHARSTSAPTAKSSSWQQRLATRRILPRLSFRGGKSPLSFRAKPRNPRSQQMLRRGSA